MKPYIEDYEAYVSLEVAELLEQNFFDFPCNSIYEWFDNTYLFTIRDKVTCLDGDNYIYAPTQQQARAWLRSKGIHIVIDLIYTTEKRILYQCKLVDSECKLIGCLRALYESYEDALEEGLYLGISKL